MGFYLIHDGTGEMRHTTSHDIGAIYDLADMSPEDKTAREYHMVFTGMEQLTRDKDLNATDWRVFSYLCEKMDKVGWADITQDAIAREVQTYRANVSSSIKKLIGKGYISKQQHPATERMTLRVEADVAGWGNIARDRARRAAHKKITGGKRNINNMGEYVATSAKDESR